MKIVEIWSKAESLYGALDVLFDMRGRVSDLPVSKDVETALGGN